MTRMTDRRTAVMASTALLAGLLAGCNGDTTDPHDHDLDIEYLNIDHLKLQHVHDVVPYRLRTCEAKVSGCRFKKQTEQEPWHLSVLLGKRRLCPDCAGPGNPSTSHVQEVAINATSILTSPRKCKSRRTLLSHRC